MVERTGAPYNERDARTRRYMYHIHSLRKFFRTQLSLGTGNPDIAETLMGHKGYLTDSYRSISEKELAKQYLKGMNHLLVYTNVDLIKGYTSELESRQDSMNITIANQSKSLEGIKQRYETEIQTLKEENKTLQDNFSILLNRMDDLVEQHKMEEERAEISGKLNKWWAKEEKANLKDKKATS